MTGRMIAVCTCIVVASAQPIRLEGQDLSRYRDFHLGSDLRSLATQTGVLPSDVKIVHQRPAVMQDVEWRPRYFLSSTPRTDPVQEMIFSFYNDQLFRVVVDYDRGRTEGLTDADMIEAISVTYGPPSKPTPRKNRAAAADVDGDADTPLARWGDADYSVTLLRRSYPVTFRMIVASTRLESLARTAGAEAVRLDAREAPQREVARQKQEADDNRVAQEKARLVNKAAFKP